MLSIFLFAVLALLHTVIAEVTLVGNPQVIYDRSPKIRLKGSGFDADDHDIKLEMSAAGLPPLKVGKDFSLTKDEDGEGVILKLMAGRRYVFFRRVLRVSAYIPRFSSPF